MKFDADGRFVVAKGSKIDDHALSIMVTFQFSASGLGSHVIEVLLAWMGEGDVEDMLTSLSKGPSLSRKMSKAVWFLQCLTVR